MAYARIKPRRGNLYEWTTVNTILEEGELALEYAGDKPGTGLCKFKIGDGSTKYSELDYAFDGASASSIHGGDATTSHLIQIRADTSTNWTAANVVLNQNEIAFDTTNKIIKIGDGTTAWNDLKGINAMSASSVASGAVFDFGAIEDET